MRTHATTAEQEEHTCPAVLDVDNDDFCSARVHRWWRKWQSFSLGLLMTPISRRARLLQRLTRSCTAFVFLNKRLRGLKALEMNCVTKEQLLERWPVQRPVTSAGLQQGSSSLSPPTFLFALCFLPP